MRDGDRHEHATAVHARVSTRFDRVPQVERGADGRQQQRQQAQRVGDGVVGKRVDPVRDVHRDHRRRIRIDHQRHRQHRQHRDERQHEPDEQRAAHLRQHDVDQHAPARRAEIARRLDVLPFQRRHRAGEQQRHERRLLPDERDDDAAPVEHRLCASSGSISPAPISTWFSMPFFARNVRITCPATTNGMNSGQR